MYQKNNKLSVPQFLNQMKHINMLISQFSSADKDSIFNTDEIKKLFYHSMPVRWCTNFLNSGQDIQEVFTEVLRTYMVQQEA